MSYCCSLRHGGYPSKRLSHFDQHGYHVQVTVLRSMSKIFSTVERPEAYVMILTLFVPLLR